MTDELNPCPFCGGTPEMVSRNKYVKCLDCGARGPKGAPFIGAAEGWNYVHGMNSRVLCGLMEFLGELKTDEEEGG